MIYREKDDILDPGFSLNSYDTLEEYFKAQYHYRVEKIENFKFKAYKNEDVKNKLTSIFKEKCAYCESYHDTTSFLNVEHFRPKGNITLESGGKTTTGYWWLASKWDNLLPSCVSCNSVKKYEIDGKTITLGKGNYFPLHNIDDRYRENPNIGEEDYEIPLLVNPTKENPLHYLSFSYRHNLSIVQEKNEDEFVLLKGNRTIKYYALNRPSLVKKRTEEIKSLAYHLYNLEGIICATSGKNPFHVNLILLKLIKESFRELNERYLNKDKEYYQAKYSYYKNWLSGLDKKKLFKITKYIKRFKGYF